MTAAAEDGALETTSGMSLGSERTFEAALSGGESESGVDMVVYLTFCLFELDDSLVDKSARRWPER